MNSDFFYACTIGWSILLLFWIIILTFVHFRKPPKSNISLKLLSKSFVVFTLGYFFIYVLG